MKRISTIMAAFLGMAISAAGAQTLPAPAPHADNEKLQKMPIEVCFVLDTTGSMGGLIEGAKQKIWSIANAIAKDNPKAPLKAALVPYRDRGDVYVTKVIDLTDDLDTIYGQLMTFRAEGGGDEPESVNQALQDAVEKVTWSREDAVHIIFLVGDAPPHMDYQDDVKYPVTLEKAVRKNIVVDAIQCGNIADTTPIWKDIALKGEGTYLQLSQTGDMVAVATPQDKQLGELNAELAKTIVPYGSQRQQAEVGAKAAYAATAPASVAADRAVYNLGGGAGGRGGRAVQGQGDLVNDMQSNKDLLSSLKPEELPDDLRKMTPEEQKAFVDKQLARRNELNAQIAAVARERDAYLKAEAEKNQKADSFDLKVVETVHDNVARARATAADQK